MTTRPAPEFPAPELDTVPQFAARANVSVRTIRRKIDEGLPIIKIGRATRIDPPVGMHFLKEGRTPPPPVGRGRPRKISAIRILVLALVAPPSGRASC